MWNYINYKAYLDNKDKNEFYGIEKYIYNKIENNEIDWFPIGKSTCINNAIDDKTKENCLKNI